MPGIPLESCMCVCWVGLGWVCACVRMHMYAYLESYYINTICYRLVPICIMLHHSESPTAYQGEGIKQPFHGCSSSFVHSLSRVLCIQENVGSRNHRTLRLSSLGLNHSSAHACMSACVHAHVHGMESDQLRLG